MSLESVYFFVFSGNDIIYYPYLKMSDLELMNYSFSRTL